MKNVLQRTVCGALLTTCASVVSAATVFAPTDGDVNFLFGDLQGGSLAMFDDSDQSYTGLYIDVPVPSIVGISGPVNSAGDHIATNSSSQSLTLTGSDQFILGLNVDGSWLADSSVTQNGANAYTVAFDNGGSVVEVDVEIVGSPVPVPAALWLFGSGILGFTMIGRRQRQ